MRLLLPVRNNMLVSSPMHSPTALAAAGQAGAARERESWKMREGHVPSRLLIAQLDDGIHEF